MGLFKVKKQQEAGRRPQLMEGQNDYLFRRSRTLTGSVSSEVRAAAEAASHLQSPRLKTHKLKQHRRGIAGSLVVVALLIGG
jgi:hypothetical protein